MANVNHQALERAIEQHRSGRLAEAIQSYQDILRHAPNEAAVLYWLGMAHFQRGDPLQAIPSIQRALEIRPDLPGGFYNLGSMLQQLGRHEDAIEPYRQAIATNTQDFEAFNNLGAALKALKRPAEALECYERAATIKPDHPETLYNLGNLLAATKRELDAVQAFDRAIALRPDFVEAIYNRGLSLIELNRWQEAIVSFDGLLALHPDHAQAKFARCMAELPILYTDEAEIAVRRAAYETRLRELHKEVASHPTPRVFAGGVGRPAPFYLAYQGCDDRALQMLYGTTICRIMADHYPQAALPPPPAPNEPVRVGFVSAFFRQHSVWKILAKGWLGQLDRRRFRLFGYHAGAEEDSETEIAAAMCEHFVRGPRDSDAWRAAILSDAPHVLIYPELGMDSIVVKLAAQRLAPVQCCSWGHPDTTGLPTVDYFLSSDLMEPPDGEQHYSETLIRLPLSSVYYEPLVRPSITLTRADLKLRSSATVFWSAQSLYKYLPQYDQVFPRIARQVPDSQFVFIDMPGLGGHFQQRLAMAFSRFGLDATSHCVVLPRMSAERFLAAIGQCDIVLDSIGWSGGNTTLESLLYDLPIVTLAGGLMRSRHSAAFLRIMEIAETTAMTLDDYVAVAVRLAKDAAWRSAISAKIVANKPRLCRDRAPITALEDFLDRVARSPR